MIELWRDCARCGFEVNIVVWKTTLQNFVSDTHPIGKIVQGLYVWHIRHNHFLRWLFY